MLAKISQILKSRLQVFWFIRQRILLHSRLSCPGKVEGWSRLTRWYRVCCKGRVGHRRSLKSCLLGLRRISLEVLWRIISSLMRMKTARNKINFLMKVNNWQKSVRDWKKMYKKFNIMDRSFNRHINLLLQKHYLIKQWQKWNKKIKIIKIIKEYNK